MAKSKTDKAADNMSDYATRHLRRMYSGLFALGTALGAGMMAAKKNHDKNALQRFIDNIGR
jgi:hypothetical protein